MVDHEVEEPERLAQAVLHHGAGGLVDEARREIDRQEQMVRGLLTEARRLGDLANRLGPSGPLYFALDARRHGFDHALSHLAHDVGTLVPDVVLIAATDGFGETAAADTEAAEANVRAAARAAARAKAAEAATPPLAFSNMDEFAQFGHTMRTGLEGAGYHDVDIAVSGSSVTGVSWRTGEPFDIGRVSDLDVALGSDDLFEAAREAGVKTWSRDTRTPPLETKQLRRLGLQPLTDQLSSQLGRKVSLMLYRSIDTALARRLTVMVPGG
jgi:hypothetical protein